MQKIVAVFMMTSLCFGMAPFEIAQRVKASSDGYGSSRSVIEMVLVDQAKNESTRLMHSMSLENQTGDKEEGDKSLMEFKTPLDVMGTKFLTHEKTTRNNNQWLYLPALKRVKRISSESKSGAFMGSEFSYEDIASREPSKYTYSKEAIETTCEGTPCYMYERYPKDEHSGYSKQMVWVDKKQFVVLKIDFYDKKHEVLKTATYGGYQQIGQTYRVKNITMHNHQNLKSTFLNYLEDAIHLNLDPSLFTERYLRD